MIKAISRNVTNCTNSHYQVTKIILVGPSLNCPACIFKRCFGASPIIISPVISVSCCTMVVEQNCTLWEGRPIRVLLFAVLFHMIPCCHVVIRCSCKFFAHHEMIKELSPFNSVKRNIQWSINKCSLKIFERLNLFINWGLSL